ncbi:MAG: MFS transporter, partial [Actinomycetota bacterium]
METVTQRGIKNNLRQFTLLIAMNALVGALVGQERTLIPLLAEHEFAVSSSLATSLFLVTFGLAKAPSNLLAGLLAERYGPRRVQIWGWIFGIPVPLMLMFGPSWGWVIAANLLLGINQGLTWSTTVLMKIQLAADHERGKAVGLNEFAGYSAVGLSALLSGLIADKMGIRPAPFVLGMVVVLAGVVFSGRWLRDSHRVTVRHPHLELRAIRGNPVLRICSRTGLVNNANDAFVWALMPVLLARAGMATGQIAVVAAAYPIAWGVLQLATGTMSDRLGRKGPIAGGMLLQAVALVG